MLSYAKGMLIISTFGLEPQIGALPIESFRPFWNISNIFHKQTAPKIEILIEFHKQIKGTKTDPSHSILLHSGHVQALQKLIPSIIRPVSSVETQRRKPWDPYNMIGKNSNLGADC